MYNENYGQMLFDISKMIRRIIYNYKLDIIGDLPEFYKFIDTSKNITMLCLNNMESEESDISCDSIDAFDELLYAWTSLSKCYINILIVGKKKKKKKFFLIITFFKN